MKTLKKNINKWDLILVTAFLSIAAISFIGYRIIHQAPAVTVEISSFGQVVETVDISKDGTYEIPNALGGFNTITVKDGQVSCTEASCPDKICIHQGHISHNGEMIVCLPNQMITKVIGNNK